MTRKVELQVLVDPDQLERLRALAKRTRWSMAEHVRAALAQHLAAHVEQQQRPEEQSA